MISCYDLDDNLITIFENYRDCAKWFNTSIDVIYSYICKSQKGIVDKKRNIKDKTWYRLFKIEQE